MTHGDLIVDPIERVVEAFGKGDIVVIADDVDRENEGDLALATDFITPEKVAFMAEQARGLICVSISTEIAQRLDLPLQVLNNNSPFHTPFTLSIDHRSVLGQGITSSARCLTMKALLEESASAGDFVSPGHVFPLIANPAGVFARQGQTEASYDMSRLCNLGHSAVICEILNPDGTMARGATLNQFAKTHGLLVTTVAEIMKFRLARDTLATKSASSIMKTDFGECVASVYEDEVERKEHLLVVYGDLERVREAGTLVRIHSECLTGDVFGSRRCDCGLQLQQSLKVIQNEGAGIVLYLRQEGRGIGLLNKLRAYELQDGGADTVEANVRLGFDPDKRDFAVAANILLSLGIKKIRLTTNNPRKLDTMRRFGLEVSERIPVVHQQDEYSRSYLEAKRTKLGHML